MCTRYISPEMAAIERAWRIRPQDPLRWPPEVFPRRPGPFLRLPQQAAAGEPLELVVGAWGLIPWFAKTRELKYATSNARFEELSAKASYRQPWARNQRCLIPAWSFDEPNWESGRNVWWRFRRRDGMPWGLAGLWNRWTDPATGELVESYTMLTVNADDHPLMQRMHKPDPRLPADRQDKRSVVAIESGDVERWLLGSAEQAAALARPPAMAVIEGAPVPAVPRA